MKILITGAHFTPAVATIEELKKIEGVSIVYAGRKTTFEGDNSPSPESQVLPSLGVKFIPIVTGRLQRAFTIHTIPSLLKLPVGFIQALYIILSEKPNVVLSFGGYPAVPIVIISWFFSIPVIIHEQTLKLGLANKLCSYFADKIAVSFEDSYKGEKIVLTGNPIRHEISKISVGAKLVHPPGGRRLPMVLVMGGNQGAHCINVALEQALDKLLKITSIIHVTGNNKYNDFERLQKFQNDRYKVTKWIDKGYGDVLQKADMVICRAGINTLMELASLAKPTLTVPIAFGEEQTRNAGYFAQVGLARILPQSKLSGESLIDCVKSMLKKLVDLKKKAREAKKVIIPDGAKRLALETVLLVNNESI